MCVYEYVYECVSVWVCTCVCMPGRRSPGSTQDWKDKWDPGRAERVGDSKHLAGREQPPNCSQARSRDKIQMLRGPWRYSLAGC